MLTYAAYVGVALLLLIFLVLGASFNLGEHLLYELKQINSETKKSQDHLSSDCRDIAALLGEIRSALREMSTRKELIAIEGLTQDSRTELVTIRKGLEKVLETGREFSSVIDQIRDRAEDCAGSLRSLDDFKDRA